MLDGAPRLTNFLMGDVSNGSMVPQCDSQSKTFENISQESVESHAEKGIFSPIELENILLPNTDSVELALKFAKTWSKYTKNIISWVERKLILELEYNRNLVKLTETTKSNIEMHDFMPLHVVFNNALLNDIKNTHHFQQAIASLQSNKFVQPLLGRKNEMEKQRKILKELWKQGQHKMVESETALKKAKFLCMQRQEEYDKAKSAMFRAEEEHLYSSGGGLKNANKQLEKKRRLEEEALQKVEEANELYKACVTNVEDRRNDLKNTKREILIQLKEIIYQCDLTLKAVTVNLFQMQQQQAASVANQMESFCCNAKQYYPGKEYSDFIVTTNSVEEKTFIRNVNKQLPNSPCTPGYQPTDSFDGVHFPDTSKVEEDNCTDATGPFIRSWTLGLSDSESTGGSSESRSLDSESTSPGDFQRKLPRTPSSGTMSSAEDLEDREMPSPAESGPLGLSKKALVSKAALTHKFRKLRSPAKCRDCEGIVVFHGVECEECLLGCHKRCLENLVILCGRQKLLGKAHVFGAEFLPFAKKEPDGIPFVLKLCISEIENKALSLQGIYRINGNKARIEKLCQALENGHHFVDMSEFSSHDICNALKFYLRQLPEPFILFRLYNEFIALAKEIQHLAEEQESKKEYCEEKKKFHNCVEVNRILVKSKDLLRQLPLLNFNSFHYLIAHLKRVVDNSERNKMDSKNLGVIFGPTLVRPRPTTAPVTYSSIAEYSNQAQLIEFIITYSKKIFDGILQSQDLGSASVVPYTDSGSIPKQPLSPEARDSEKPVNSLCLSTKEDIHTADSESTFSDSLTSPQNSQVHNALEKCDACQLVNKLNLPANQELESTSTNMETVCKTSRESLQPFHSDRESVLRRIPRSTNRPVSLPVDRFLLLASPPKERNGRIMGKVNSDECDRNPALDGMHRKDNPAVVCSKVGDFHLPTVQNPQVKESEQDGPAAKTTVAVPSALHERGVMSPNISGDVPACATQHSHPHTEPVRPGRQVSERQSSDSCPLTSVRAPRTLQPQHWTTFYKPHAPSGGVKGEGEKLVAPSTAVPLGTNCAPQGSVLSPVPDSENACARPAHQASKPQENSEEQVLPDVRPACQRPRLKRMQQFEDLEDEIPQFV